MRGSRNFCQGGSRPDGQKTVPEQYGFFSPQLILQFTEGVQWFYCKENYTFPWIHSLGEGPTFSRGGGGSKCLFLYKPIHPVFLSIGPSVCPSIHPSTLPPTTDFKLPNIGSVHLYDKYIIKNIWVKRLGKK